MRRQIDAESNLTHIFDKIQRDIVEKDARIIKGGLEIRELGAFLIPPSTVSVVQSGVFQWTDKVLQGEGIARNAH